MAEITHILTANIRRQFSFVIITTTSTRCLVQNFQLREVSFFTGREDPEHEKFKAY